MSTLKQSHFILMLWLPLSALIPASGFLVPFLPTCLLLLRSPLTSWDSLTGHFLVASSSLPSAGADLKERERMSAAEVGTFVQRLRGLMSEIGESWEEGREPLLALALPLPDPTPSPKTDLILF